MDEIIFCNKCNNEINTKEDDWYRTTSFKGEEIESEIFFHKQCYNDFHKDKFKEEYNKKIKLLAPIIKKLFRKPDTIPI